MVKYHFKCEDVLKKLRNSWLEFNFTFSFSLVLLVALHCCGKSEKIKKSSYACWNIKLIVSAEKHSQLTEEGQEERCLFSSWNDQKDITGRKWLSVKVDSELRSAGWRKEHRVWAGLLVNHCSVIVQFSSLSKTWNMTIIYTGLYRKQSNVSKQF